MPFIGQEVHCPWIDLDKDIASRWVKHYGYPLEDSHQLSQVAQFLGIEKMDDLYPKMLLSKELATIKPPDFGLEKFINTPYSGLTDLALPFYITTNYDYFMEVALESKGRKPVSEFCRWNEELYNYAKAAGIPSVFDKGEKNYTPTIDQPLVYHLHGVFNIPRLDRERLS